MHIRKSYLGILLLLVAAALVAGVWRWREGRQSSAVAGWLRDHAIPLTTVDPAANLSDLAELDAVIGDARILGVGEATHGTREHFLFKHRLLRYLVTKKGFRALAFESPWPTGLALNDYVLGGEGNPEHLLGRAVFGVWYTQEVLDTIRWMREYNATVGADQRVEFVGIDMQLTRHATVAVRTYIDRVDPTFRRKHAAALDLLASQEMEPLYIQIVDNEPQIRNTPESRAVSAAVREVLARFDSQRDQYIAGSSATEYDLARQHARILVQQADVWEDVNEGDRDRYMAQNLEWYLARRPGVKVMVWAHNGHVTFAPRANAPLGRHLKDRHGADYVSIGFVLGSGAFRALDRRNLRPGEKPQWKQFRFGLPPRGSFDALMAAAGHAIFAVDLRRANGPIRQNLDRLLRLREGYGVVMRPDPLTTLKRSLPATHDVVIFIDHTTPAQPISPTNIPLSSVGPFDPHAVPHRRTLALRPAPGRNDAVHAQVHHHLPEVVHAVFHHDHRDLRPRHLAFAEGILHRASGIVRANGVHGLVRVGEGILEILHDFRLGLQGFGAVIALADIHRRLFAHERGGDQEIGGGDVAHLLAKGAHALEFALTGREPVVLLGHGLGQFHHLALHVGQRAVHDVGESGLGLGLLRHARRGEQQDRRQQGSRQLSFHCNLPSRVKPNDAPGHAAGGGMVSRMAPRAECLLRG